MKDQEIHPERIERGHENTGYDGEIGETGGRQVAGMDRFDDAVLGVETREQRHAYQGQRSEQRGDPGDAHVLAQTAHIADVLIMVHADDHRTGGEE